jgi:hypothetical protein
MSGTNIKELVKLIGSSVDLELIGGVTFSGVVYSVDADSGLVALRENVIGHQADYNIVNAAHIIKFSPGPGGPVSAELREHLSRKVAAVPEDTLQKFYARESDQARLSLPLQRYRRPFLRCFLVYTADFCPSRLRGYQITSKGRLGVAFRRKRSGFSMC